MPRTKVSTTSVLPRHPHTHQPLASPKLPKIVEIEGELRKMGYACAVAVVTHSPTLNADEVRACFSKHEEIRHSTVEIQRCSAEALLSAPGLYAAELPQRRATQ